jgi:hypothetical protein
MLVGLLSDSLYVVKIGFHNLPPSGAITCSLKVIDKQIPERSLFIMQNLLNNNILLIFFGRARWLRGQCARSAIAEAKQRSQRSVIGWLTKIYYLEFLRACFKPLVKNMLCRPHLVWEKGRKKKILLLFLMQNVIL